MAAVPPVPASTETVVEAGEEFVVVRSWPGLLAVTVKLSSAMLANTAHPLMSVVPVPAAAPAVLSYTLIGTPTVGALVVASVTRTTRLSPLGGLTMVEAMTGWVWLSLPGWP